MDMVEVVLIFLCLAGPSALMFAVGLCCGLSMRMSPKMKAPEEGHEIEIYWRLPGPETKLHRESCYHVRHKIEKIQCKLCKSCRDMLRDRKFCTNCCKND